MAYSVVTSVLCAAASQDLTDLATVRDELSIAVGDTSSDAWLGRAISQVSASIATYTNRVFAPERVIDVLDIQQDPYPYQTPGGFPQLQLSRHPVLSVGSVAQTLAAASSQPLTVGVDFRTDPATGRLMRLNPFTGAGVAWEAAPVSVTYTAGFGALVQEAQTVPASPYQVTVSQAAAYSCDVGVSYASGAALALVQGVPAPGQYAVARGVYTFNAADTAQSLTFTYATAAIPLDLVDACLRLITGRFAAKDRDPNLILQETPGVGTQRWWFGGAPGQKGPFPPDIQGLLDAYRTPTIA